jgi:hypothetical protein
VNLRDIGQNFYGDKLVELEQDVCKAKPMFELPVDPKFVVPTHFNNIEVFGDRCIYDEEPGKVFMKIRKGEIVGRIICEHLKEAICSKISNGRSNDGALKCANLGVTFYNAVSCVWPNALERFQEQDIDWDKMGLTNVTIGF